MIECTVVRAPRLTRNGISGQPWDRGAPKWLQMVWLGLLFVFIVIASAAQAVDTGQTKSVDGLTVYFGVIPAEIIRGHPPGHPERSAHGGPPSGRHSYHVIVAIFDAATGARVTDAKVSAQVASLGLSGPTRELEPMTIADTVTYGNYFTLPSRGPYRILIEIARAQRVTKMTFDYDH